VGTIAFTRDQIVNIKKFPGEQSFQKSITRNRVNFGFGLYKRELIALLLLTLYLRYKLFQILELRT